MVSMSLSKLMTWKRSTIITRTKSCFDELIMFRERLFGLEYLHMGSFIAFRSWRNISSFLCPHQHSKAYLCLWQTIVLARAYIFIYSIWWVWQCNYNHDESLWRGLGPHVVQQFCCQGCKCGILLQSCIHKSWENTLASSMTFTMS